MNSSLHRFGEGEVAGFGSHWSDVTKAEQDEITCLEH